MSGHPNAGDLPDLEVGAADPSGEPASAPAIDSDGAVLTAMAAELERIALEPGPRPSAGFADRVGAAIAREPMPVPMAAAGNAVRRHSAPGMAAALRDSARVGFGSHRPVTARAGAFAMLAVAALIVVSVGGALAFGAASVFVPAPQATDRDERATVSPTLQLTPTESSEPTNSTSVGEPSPGPSSSPIDNDGPGASPRGTADPDGSLKPGQTPKPSESARDSDDPTQSPSPSPSATPHGSDPGH
jgi:hypothetical protein